MQAISTMKGRIAVLITALVAMSGCASTPNTFANADPATDFTRFQSFGFVETMGTDFNDYESLETNYLKTAISGEMESRGLVASNSPDLLINFRVHTQEKIKSHSVPTGGFYDFYDPFYDVWGTTYGGGWRTELRQYTEGTLTIDVIDAQSKRLVWEGAAIGRISDKDLRNLESSVQNAVTEIMKDYPIVAAAS